MVIVLGLLVTGVGVYSAQSAEGKAAHNSRLIEWPGQEKSVTAAVPVWKTRIDQARVNYVTLKEAAELRVTVDLLPDQIRRVMYFESGFGWMGQHGLGYNPACQCWTGKVTPGNRAAIQENEYIYVWAEGIDGLRSEYTPVKVGWDFTTLRNK